MTKPGTHRIHRAVWFIATLLLLSLSACGGGDDSGTTTPPATDTVTPDTSVTDTTTQPCEPQCANKTCGDDGCGSTCGSCATLETCNANGVCEPDPTQCTPNCPAGSCGDDGCGGQCACTGAEICNDTTKTCEADPKCNGFTFAGCCDGTTLKWCEKSEVKSADCEESENTCGWNADQDAYWCVEVEGTETDPSGANSGVCPDCTPACDGVEACAADGCGGVCDTCEAGASCFEGACCTPSCDGKSCGSDGCGGSCGTCSNGDTCAPASGQCIADPCADGSVTYEGCCDGEVLKYCEDGYKEIDCGQADSSTPNCGWDTEGSYYNCNTDGGADPSGTHPKDCSGPCEPVCDGKVCGDNGCGGTCGDCDGTCSEDGSVCTPKPCVTGESCTTDNKCDIAEIACDADGKASCVKTGTKPDNLSCGGGMICKSGDCVPAS